MYAYHGSVGPCRGVMTEGHRSCCVARWDKSESCSFTIDFRVVDMLFTRSSKFQSSNCKYDRNTLLTDFGTYPLAKRDKGILIRAVRLSNNNNKMFYQQATNEWILQLPDATCDRWVNQAKFQAVCACTHTCTLWHQLELLTVQAVFHPVLLFVDLNVTTLCICTHTELVCRRMCRGILSCFETRGVSTLYLCIYLLWQ